MDAVGSGAGVSRSPLLTRCATKHPVCFGAKGSDAEFPTHSDIRRALSSVVMTTPDRLVPPPATRCYRHPDRITYVQCTRCGRQACPDCLHAAAVGHQCVDCVGAAARTVRQPRTIFGVRRRTAITPVVSYALIAVNVAMFMMQSASVTLERRLVLWPPAVADGEVWRILTSAFLHDGLAHILFNMWALWFVGPSLERWLPEHGSRHCTC